MMRKTVEKLTTKTTKVFMRLREYNLKCNPRKCKWFITKIKILGYKVTGYGVKPESKKVLTKEFAISSNKKIITVTINPNKLFFKIYRRPF